MKIGHYADSVVGVLLGEEYREFANFVPYWMSPQAELIRVPNHVTWAKAHVLLNTPFHDPKAGGVLLEMRRLGWLRIVIEGKTLFMNPAHATRVQIQEVKDHATENHLQIVDDVTQRPYFDPDEG